MAIVKISWHKLVRRCGHSSLETSRAGLTVDVYPECPKMSTCANDRLCYQMSLLLNVSYTLQKQYFFEFSIQFKHNKERFPLVGI